MQVMFRAAARGTRAPETARHASAGESVARKSLARAKASPGVAPVAGGGSRIVMHFAVVGRPQLYSGPRCDGGDKSHAGGDDGRLILLSQKVAGFVEKNHVFGKIHFSACGGLRWVCQNQVTLHRGFRGMSRV